MTEPVNKPKRQMPKGGRKGGAVFPRICLKDAYGYAKKLVSKTHVQAQPVGVILSGVVGSKGGNGLVRMSALKQYGFLKGDNKSGFSATDSAKQIVSSPPEELLVLLKKAVLGPTIFKNIFDTFHGDSVSRAKLKQRAADLKVHPDETEACIEIYSNSLEFAELVTIRDDEINHKAINAEPAGLDVNMNCDEEADVVLDSKDENELLEEQQSSGVENGAPDFKTINPILKPRAVFNVNISLDSSLDIEKLAKQLELLKKFGAI